MANANVKSNQSAALMEFRTTTFVSSSLLHAKANRTRDKSSHRSQRADAEKVSVKGGTHTVL